MSAGSGHIAIVRLQLDNGVDLYAVDKEGLAPAGCVKLFAQRELKQFLEKRKRCMMTLFYFSFIIVKQFT